jgi:hypothetical protein
VNKYKNREKEYKKSRKRVEKQFAVDAGIVIESRAILIAD